MANNSAAPKLVIAISSTALFDMRESHSIYETQGVDAYAKYQREREDDILEPGEAFPLATKLLRINEKLGGDPRVEIILLSRNSADTGLRVFNSIAHHGLKISRAAFRGAIVPIDMSLPLLVICFSPLTLRMCAAP
jgi:5'-nucleotidase